MNLLLAALPRREHDVLSSNIESEVAQLGATHADVGGDLEKVHGAVHLGLDIPSCLGVEVADRLGANYLTRTINTGFNAGISLNALKVAVEELVVGLGLVRCLGLGLLLIVGAVLTDDKSILGAYMLAELAATIIAHVVRSIVEDGPHREEKTRAGDVLEVSVAVFEAALQPEALKINKLSGGALHLLQKRVEVYVEWQVAASLAQTNEGVHIRGILLRVGSAEVNDGGAVWHFASHIQSRLMDKFHFISGLV